jgi:NAD(P)-dependent dehydrogenase (short-subunit alcohol dehydrogenase family)
MSHLTPRRVALITGASKGLGRTISEFLAAQNYELIITARHADELQSTAQALTQLGGVIHAVVGDVSDANYRQALASTVENIGQLDLLINNASTLGETPMPTMIEYSLQELTAVFNINVIAPVALIQAVLPTLKKSNGLVVNVSSDAARGGYETWGGYGASKAALDLISLTLANELRGEGVGVVSVDPGDMRTEMHQAAFPDEDISDRPLPEVTIPFWAWLLGQDTIAVSGRRFEAQAERWEVAS